MVLGPHYIFASNKILKTKNVNFSNFLQVYRQKSQIDIASTHSVSAMYVLTDITELETDPDSCVDRLAREPSHTALDCCVGRVVGEGWRCGGRERESQDMFEEDVEELETLVDGVEEILIQLPKNYQLIGPKVWEERNLMSPWAARPLFLAMVREGLETLTPLFRNYLDPEIHLLTHYSSPPSWEGTEVYLWSPRMQRVVSRDECKVVRVEGRTVMRNPLRRSMVELGTLGGEQESDTVMNRKRKRQEVIRMTQSEAQKRFLAYKHLVERGRLKEVRIEENHSVSPKCDSLNCDHLKEEDRSCSVVFPTYSHLEAAIKTFNKQLSKS